MIDEKYQIYHVKSEDGLDYKVNKLVNLSSQAKVLDALSSDEWARVHISDKSITINNVAYSLVGDVSKEIKLTNTYFGQVEPKEDAENERDMKLLSVQNMQMSTGILALWHDRKRNEFCF